jgi:hypothetical protein
VRGDHRREPVDVREREADRRRHRSAVRVGIPSNGKR